MTSKYDHEVIHHDPSEGYDPTEPAASQITMFVIVSVVTLVVVIGAIQFYFDAVWESSVYEKVLAAPGPDLGKQRNLEAWRMNHYEYATPEKTTVRIPFERAKELFLAEQAQGQVFYKAQPTTPVPETPEGAAAPAGEANAPAAEAGKQ